MLSQKTAQRRAKGERKSRPDKCGNW